MESIVLLGRYQLVRVHTDEGVVGVGEVNTQPTVGTLAHLHLWISTPTLPTE